MQSLTVGQFVGYLQIKVSDLGDNSSELEELVDDEEIDDTDLLLMIFHHSLCEKLIGKALMLENEEQLVLLKRVHSLIRYFNITESHCALKHIKACYLRIAAKSAIKKYFHQKNLQLNGIVDVIVSWM
jgi:hypothetical protein